MAKVVDIVNLMKALAPVELAEDWDNVGLLIGDSEREVNKIIVMLDFDKQGLEEALAVGADMIITHHPAIMPKISSITDPLYLTLIENKISLCSMHTNLDSADEGVNQVLAETLGLSDIEPIDFDGLFGRIGYISECTLGEFIQTVKLALDIDHVRYVGSKKNIINKVAVVGGGGADFIPNAKIAGCDVYITADVKYHQAQLADKLGLNVIDAGHFETENPVIHKVSRYLRGNVEEVEVITSLRNKSYIKYE
ncbi:MAG: Nif3-like dinuclear metal center hexameric protein [Clostridia bacterium]|nr:Nif3-like dinuclear metal center hexameric protein [Clostridia bacterium]